MKMAEIFVDPTTYVLLKEIGRMDCNDGKDRDTGWREVSTKMGYSAGRTPAREAYEDGYYSGSFGSTKK